jgi:salicylate hydroxylase
MLFCSPLPLPKASLGLHRTQFTNLLVNLLSETNRVNTYFGKRCVSFSQDTDAAVIDQSAMDSVTLHFTDGTCATCDVLVGSDGIKSAVRGELMSGRTEPITNKYTSNTTNDWKRLAGTTFSGTVAYRALVKPEDLKAVSADHSAISVRKMVCPQYHDVIYRG